MVPPDRIAARHLDNEGIAALAQSTFWFILPTLADVPAAAGAAAERRGFWTALGLSCLLTLSLYAAMVWTLGRFGISL